MAKIKVVHYVNQFYAGIGGEEKADITPELRVGTVPAGDALNKAWGEEAEITHTIICGDSYFGENMDKASAEIMEMVKSTGADMFIAGPAFNAGRYGVACGTIATNVKNTLGIPVLTGMYVENPGADMYKTQIYIVATKDSGAGMRDAIKKMAPLALKLARGEKIEASCVEGYIPNGVRVNLFEKECGAARAVKMLIAKLNDKPFVTEFPMPDFDRVEPNPAILDMAHATVALCTSGGTVPKGNPDRIESSSASHYGEYDITGVNSLDSEHWETAHGGYDPVYVNEDGNRCLPVDIMREMEASGRIGKLHNKFYTTVGNGTAVLSSKAFAEEYAQKMINDGVDCVIMTSTWGTCTRCGATMVKEIERAGLPVVHICTVTPISMTVGANRIVPAIAIPHPLGNPALDLEGEKHIRRCIVETALKALETEVDEQTIFDVKY